MSQLADLARPFPDYLIEQKPGGYAASYVSHSTVVEKLLAVLGPYSFEITQLIRDGGQGEVVGCLGRLTVSVDGTPVTVTEVGDCENPGNWKNDGARAKDAASDAIKRCAMRLGCGLHLWSQSAYQLHDVLSRREAPPAAELEAARVAAAARAET